MTTLLLATTARAWNLPQAGADGAAPIVRPNWPRAFDANGEHVVMYRPQFMTWSGARIKGRAAVAVSTPSGARTYGVAYFSGEAEIDRAAGLVALTQIAFAPVDIPTDADMARRIKRALATGPCANGMDISLDELQLSYAASQGFARAMRKTICNRPLADWVKEMTSGYLFKPV